MAIIVVLLLIAILIFGPGLWVRRVLERYSAPEDRYSGTGAQLARHLLNKHGLESVAVERTAEGDHYDPQDKAVRLTDDKFDGRSLTAITVAAHEVGHAIQDHTGYKPLITRTRMIGTARKIERFGAVLMMGVPVLAALTRAPSVGVLMFLAGFATLCIPVLVHLLTLPTEFDASFKRALPMLTSGAYIPSEDIPAAKKILLACALTYVSNSLIGLLNIWRWIRLLRR